MKILTIILLLITHSYCTIEDCEDSNDQNSCNSIEVEYDDFFCYKAELHDELPKCTALPKDENNQKLYWNMLNGFMKEMYSDIGSYIREEIIESKEDFENGLYKPGKDFYSTNEIVTTSPGELTSKDVEIIASENTCTYHLYGKLIANMFEENFEYPNVKNKNTCFNAAKFDEFADIIDCGYAVMKFSIDGENYEIQTCYLLPTEKLPQNFTDLYMESIKYHIEEGNIKEIFYIVAGKYDDIDLRRLSTMTYSIEVEDKNGRKVKYSSDKEGFEVISEGGSSGGNQGPFMNISLILLILFLWI